MIDAMLSLSKRTSSISPFLVWIGIAGLFCDWKNHDRERECTVHIKLCDWRSHSYQTQNRLVDPLIYARNCCFMGAYHALNSSCKYPCSVMQSDVVLCAACHDASRAATRRHVLGLPKPPSIPWCISEPQMMAGLSIVIVRRKQEPKLLELGNAMDFIFLQTESAVSLITKIYLAYGSLKGYMIAHDWVWKAQTNAMASRPNVSIKERPQWI